MSYRQSCRTILTYWTCILSLFWCRFQSKSLEMKFNILGVLLSARSPSFMHFASMGESFFWKFNERALQNSPQFSLPRVPMFAIEQECPFYFRSCSLTPSSCSNFFKDLREQHCEVSMWYGDFKQWMRSSCYFVQNLKSNKESTKETSHTFCFLKPCQNQSRSLHDIDPYRR